MFPEKRTILSMNKINNYFTVKFSKIINDPINKLLFFSGLIGFILGFLHAEYQWVIWPAQVLAGIVKYPPNNPFYMLSMKSWEILHQIAALLLKIGFSEITISIFLSAILGLLTFQALSLGIYTISRKILFSITGSFFIFFIHGVFSRGITYPITLLVTNQTYGLISLLLIMLTVELIANQKFVLGGLLLGIFPAIHPTQGIWCNIIVFISLIVKFKSIQKILKLRLIKYYLLGLIFSLSSFLVFIYQKPFFPKVDNLVIAEFQKALFLYWGDQYQKFNILGGSLGKVFISIILSIWALYKYKKLHDNIKFYFITFIVTAIVAGISSFVYWIPAEHISKFYYLLLSNPARLLNYNVLGSFILILGILNKYQKQNIFVKNSLALFIILLTIYRVIFSIYRPNKTTLSSDAITLGLMLFFGVIVILVNYPIKKWISNFTILLTLFLFYSISTIFNLITPEVFISILIYMMGTLFVGLKINLKKYLTNLTGLILIIIGFTCKKYHYSSSLIVNLIYKIIPTFFIISGVIFIITAIPLVKVKIESYYKNNLREFLIKINNKTSRLFKTLMNLSILAIVLIIFFNAANIYLNNKKNLFDNWANNEFLKTIYHRKGLILAGINGDPGLMMKTRRPVLYMGGPLVVNYSPDIGPELNRIYIIVYGIDFLNPPEDLIRKSERNIPEENVKRLWEKRSFSEWQKIGKIFNFKDVIVKADWKLNLPFVASDENFTLYTISF